MNLNLINKACFLLFMVENKWDSISEAANTLWSEAESQVRAEVNERRRVEEASGRFNDFGHEISSEAIFSKYEALVQRYLVDAKRPVQENLSGYTIYESEGGPREY